PASGLLRSLPRPLLWTPSACARLPPVARRSQRLPETADRVVAAPPRWPLRPRCGPHVADVVGWAVATRAVPGAAPSAPCRDPGREGGRGPARDHALAMGPPCGRVRACAFHDRGSRPPPVAEPRQPADAPLGGSRRRGTARPLPPQPDGRRRRRDPSHDGLGGGPPRVVRP